MHPAPGGCQICISCESAFQICQALAHGGKVFGSLHGILERQLASGGLALEQRCQCPVHAAGARLKKAFAEFRFVLDFGGDTLLEANHLRPRQESDHRFPKSGQSFPDGTGCVVKNQSAPDIFALIFDRSYEEPALVLEVIVNGYF